VNILDIHLLEGPFKGRYAHVDEDTVRRGVILIPETQRPNVRDATDPSVEFSMKVHRYLTKWTAKTGWVALYDGEE
jgi:spore coat protein CotF